MALPVRDFIIQRLLEYDPNFDVGAGVPTTSLLIDPLSIVLQPVIDELAVVQASQSILTILESSAPDNFPEDIVDGLASNVYVERNPGFIGSDVVRIRFFEPKEYSAQQGVMIFRGPSDQRYSNSESVSVTKAEMSLNQEGTLYYVDIPVVALEEGEDFNVEAGAITSMEAEPVGVANLANLYGVDQGRDRETNTELIDRIKVAVTVRALVTGRGIIVTLTENFTTIEEIQPIGFGDPEMMRDIVYNTHIGGNCDVYVKTPGFTTQSYDVFGLEVDVTRQTEGHATVVMKNYAPTAYSLNQTNIDRTNMIPIVTSIQGTPYIEFFDYEIQDASGLITKNPGSAIFHTDDTGFETTTLKILTDPLATNAFINVQPGMILSISGPVSIAGTFTVKTKIDNNNIEIYGNFAAMVTGVNWQIDDNLVVTFEYNPITIDVIKEARSTAREDFTITDVPLMYIESVEVLDPVSGDPNGTVLDDHGGYGAGGYGLGGYGIGAGADYKLMVVEPTLRFSELEDNYIEFATVWAAQSLRVNFWYASAIAAIQAFCDDRNNQNQCASLLVRHFIPVYVDGSEALVYDINVADEPSAITADEMTELIEEAINDVDEGNALEFSNLVDVFYNNGAVRVDLGTLDSLRGELHHENGTTEFILPSSDGSLTIPDEDIPDPTDKPLSPRIARFRARSVTIERNVV